MDCVGWRWSIPGEGVAPYCQAVVDARPTSNSSTMGLTSEPTSIFQEPLAGFLAWPLIHLMDERHDRCGSSGTKSVGRVNSTNSGWPSQPLAPTSPSSRVLSVRGALQAGEGSAGEVSWCWRGRDGGRDGFIDGVAGRGGQGSGAVSQFCTGACCGDRDIDRYTEVELCESFADGGGQVLGVGAQLLVVLGVQAGAPFVEFVDGGLFCLLPGCGWAGGDLSLELFDGCDFVGVIDPAGIGKPVECWRVVNVVGFGDRILALV
jgi:hypothetical protein